MRARDVAATAAMRWRSVEEHRYGWQQRAQPWLLLQLRLTPATAGSCSLARHRVAVGLRQCEEATEDVEAALAERAVSRWSASGRDAEECATEWKWNSK